MDIKWTGTTRLPAIINDCNTFWLLHQIREHNYMRMGTFLAYKSLQQMTIDQVPVNWYTLLKKNAWRFNTPFGYEELNGKKWINIILPNDLEPCGVRGYFPF